MAGITAAADLTPSTMASSSPGWIVANGNDQVTITVHVMQNPLAMDVSGANVAFSLAGGSQDLGTLSTLSATTGPDGIAQTVFRTTTKSGTATINAIITYDDGTVTTLPLSCTQRIDHSIAWNAAFDYQNDVTAGSVTQLIITLTDNGGNPVDNKNPADVHNIVLHMSGDGGSGLLEGTEYVQDLSVPTDDTGKVSLDIRVSTQAGPNNIQIYPIGSYLGDLIIISGVADSTPYYLTQEHPSPSTYPADGKDPQHRFTFYWTVLDQYHNPLENVDLYVTSSKVGEEIHLSTNADGMASTPWGPKDVAGVYTITATPVITGTSTPLNPALQCTDTGEAGYCSQTVEYTPMDPVDMIMTASPQTMVSMDVAGAQAVNVNARVVDVSGNAVEGETVTFTKSSDSYDPFTETVESSLTPPATVTTTGSSGYATVQFVPATFARQGESGYDDAATGTCTVTASWTNPKTGELKTRNIAFVWKNYPFLTVESEIDQTDPMVGDTINVKIWVRGTGAALQPKPIDVILVMDRSTSMAGSRLTSAKSAANKFIEQMRTGNGNQVGLVSFASSTTKDQSLTSDYDAVETKINTLNANGYTQMRRALYEAITDVSQNGRSNAVKAVILLTDGDWNYDGSILGHGTGWPEGSTGYTFRSALEPDNYRYYEGLGGTLISVCNLYGNSCDACNPGYNLGTGKDAGKCCPDGGGKCHLPSSEPTWCAERHCDEYSSVCLDGESTDQNMGNYAKDSSIHLYALSFESAPSAYVQTSLTTMTENTEGFYQHAPSEADLDNLYTQIAGDLVEEAGGQTKLTADFSTITVDGAVTDDVDAYLNYVYPGSSGTEASTFVKKYTEVPVDPPKNYYYEYVRDDTGNWTAKKLEFDVGKIILNDVWMTNLQFTLTGAGQIEIFGENSPVTFIDSVTGQTQTVIVPSKTWTTHQSKVDNPFASLVTLLVEDVVITPSTVNPDLRTVSWKTTYNGYEIVHEKLLYCSKSGSDPVPCDTTTHNDWPVYETRPTDITSGGTDMDGSLTIDTSTWKQGETYMITVWAETYGEKESFSSQTFDKGDGSTRAYIKLE
jgi:hypothetical protein